MKQIVQSYFTFTKKERRGIISLCALILFLSVLPSFFHYFIKPKHQDTKEFEKEIASLIILQAKNDSNVYTKYAERDFDVKDINPYPKKYTIKGELFYFDPNTITANDWKRLGVRDKTINTIQNYLSKGGRFYKPEDLGKIWGFFPDEVERLIPYVQIEEAENKYANNYPPPKKYEIKSYEKPKYAPVIIDINLADTAAYIALPGIGSKLAQRIITFREKLGGFYKIEQVAETFGLPDSTFQKIKTQLGISAEGIKQININTATVDEMKTHPYIRYHIANAIVQYRNQHGNYATVQDIKKIMIIDEGIYNKISPYLSIH